LSVEPELGRIAFDYEAEYKRLAAIDPDFEAIRRELARTVQEEMPQNMSDFEYDHATFLKGYAAVKAARFNRFDPASRSGPDAGTLTLRRRC